MGPRKKEKKEAPAFTAGTNGNNIMAEALKKAETKATPADPFAVMDITEVDARAEDLSVAKARAEAEAAEQAAIAEKAGNFAGSIFPVMAGLVERREAARGVSQKNFGLYDSQIAGYVGRPAPAGVIAATAYVMAAVRVSGGIVDPEVLVADLIERHLVRDDIEGSISRGKFRYSLSFQPMEEHRATVLQAVRERFGEAERVAREEYGRKVRELLATNQMSIWQLFAGEKGIFTFYRPFEKAAGKGKDGPWSRVFKPGVIAGQSDGQRISFTQGLGGCEMIVANCHETGLTLAVKALGDEQFFTKKDELRPLIAVHRTLWSIRRHLESQGMGPAAEANIDELGKTEGLMVPVHFFALDMPGSTLVVFDEKYEDGNPKFWKAWDRDGSQRDGDKRYNPLYNVAGILVRDKGSVVSWKAAPTHLDSYFFGAFGRVLENGKKVVKPEVHGLPLALYRWAKNKYSVKAEEVSVVADASEIPLEK